MCELFAMSSSGRATVTMSLEEFSRHGGLVGPHKDGWGIAFFDGPDARVIRDTASASTSQWARFVEDCSICSQIVISHIRKATDGELALKNTQPFARELGGRMHVFAHNGHMPGIRQDDRFSLGRFRPVGDTDSEYGFCALLARLEPLWLADDPPTIEARQRVINSFAEDVQSSGLANFIYSDGDMLVGHSHKRNQQDGTIRPPGLHILQRECSVPAGSFVADGLRVTAESMQVVLLASVPLTGEAWHPLGMGEVVTVVNGERLYGQ